MLKILKPGFFTTVQDCGRFGYRDKGVPVSGVMDSYAGAKVNALLENEESAAVLEITMTGPTLEFQADTFIALGGAEMTATLNNTPVSNYKVIKVKKGDVLSYGKLESGFRAYLGIKNGFTTSLLLGSRSFFFPVTERNSIKSLESLPYSPVKEFAPKISEMKVDADLDNASLKVYRGPEFEELTDRQLGELFSKEFSVAKENNRMAYQLNETIEGSNLSMLTSATLPGTVQLTPSGKLIILMKDGQTTGGYPRILQLADKSIDILAQKRSGDSIRFTL
ncbi:biotin-dependent carboxyltransferase family protein [Arenibacter certesii]|uniref:Urea carboxylase n=1 Tax=Arenibacter certesii TaxID=228955 RepID=A0A918IU93_9FLAO|nr:biotin-dependent carboxyltransferase family protein [Arenibacter certesii]GGW32403.1 urea carboxylase [Arenibacter certesii]